MTDYVAIRLAHLWRWYLLLTTRFVVFICVNPCLLTPLQWCIHAQHRNTTRDQSVDSCPFPRKETMGNEFIPCPNIWIAWKCLNRVRIVTYIPMGSHWRRISEKWPFVIVVGIDIQYWHNTNLIQNACWNAVKEKLFNYIRADIIHPYKNRPRVRQQHMGQVTKLRLSCYLVLLSIYSKTR